MKKIISIISALSLCILTLTACAQTEKEFKSLERVNGGLGNRAEYYNLDDLENASNVVVVGTFVDDAGQKEEYQYSAELGKDILIWINSYNTIEVSRVIKGDVDIGDNLTISGGYGVVDGRLISRSELTPMIKGDTWLFFLSCEEGSDIYWVTGDSDGRYPVSDSRNKELSVTKYSHLGVYDEQDFKSGIYNEILERYNV